ncbi:MAG TPA: efflux RND transporter permease subunit, partial [Candidatus Hydrogenedentes bacterium]|nr:efflux RND transporter permease subunit [Candidatus Hydrogenedentota bacterium]
MSDQSSDNTPQQAKQYRLAIRRPVTMIMLFLTLIVFGYKSYKQLPINLMPDISYPTLTVRTEYEGAAPEDVEQLLTRPLEETLSIVSGMVEISSISSAGLSEIIMEFTWGTDMNVAQQDVRDRLDLFDSPEDVTEKPVILRYDPTLDPVMRVAVTGPDISHITGRSAREELAQKQLTEIREAAERHIKSDLEAEVGIAQVLVKGGREKEIQVLVDSERLKNLGISMQQATAALGQQNINLSGGRLQEGKTEYLVRTKNEWVDVSEIRESIVGTANGHQVRLEDVANVYEGQKDRDTIVHINGREAVGLEIFKEGDANTVQVCNKLKDLLGIRRDMGFVERLMKQVEVMRAQQSGPGGDADMAHQRELAETLRSRLPKDCQLAIISDQSRFIIESIKEVQHATIVGGALALAILFVFLRDLKSTAIIGVSIPISVIATFVPLFARDISLNIMSLGGLALGVGMLVDNSIVVLESIFRCREEGDDVVDAADRGAREVGSAVTASTLTTIAVFLPIAFVEGIAGQIFGDLAMAVTFSLIASLIVALYLIPMIASRRPLSLVSTKDVVWMVRAYRQARADDHLSFLKALIAILPRGLGYAWQWFREALTSSFGPVVHAFSPIAATAGVFHALLLALAVPVGGIAAILFLFLQPDRLPREAEVIVWGSWILLLLLVAAKVTRRGGKARDVLRCIGAILLLPLLSALLVLQILLKLVASTLTTVLFSLCLVVAAVVLLVRTVLRTLLWAPLTLFDMGYNAFRKAYTALLNQTLRFSPVILLLVIGLAVHAGQVALGLGRELIPPLKQGEFGIHMQAPPGTRLEETERRAATIDRVVRDMDEVASVTVEIGQEKSRAASDRGENVAVFTVLLKDPEQNATRQDAIIDELRKRIQTVSSRDNEVTFTLPALFSFKTAVEIQVRGDDLDTLKRIGRQAMAAIEDIEGLKDAELSVKQGYPEVIIELDRDLLASKGLSPIDVARRLRNEIQGEVPTKFNTAGEKIDVRVRTDKKRLSSVEDLRNLSVVDGDPPLPLRSVAKR